MPEEETGEERPVAPAWNLLLILLLTQPKCCGFDPGVERTNVFHCLGEMESQPSKPIHRAKPWRHSQPGRTEVPAGLRSSRTWSAQLPMIQRFKCSILLLSPLHHRRNNCSCECQRLRRFSKIALQTTLRFYTCTHTQLHKHNASCFRVPLFFSLCVYKPPQSSNTIIFRFCYSATVLTGGKLHYFEGVSHGCSAHPEVAAGQHVTVRQF